MVTMGSLWLVIIAGGVISFVGSMLVWMVLPHHRSDYAGLPNEDATLDVLGKQSLAPGFYSFPHCSSWDALKQDDTRQKFARGPVGFMTILPSGMPAMGKNMLLQLMYFLVTGLLIAYVVHLSVPAGSDYLMVFRTTAVTAWLAYGFAIIPDAIWYGRPWAVVAKHLFDALLYALLTAGIYAWLWPAAI